MSNSKELPVNILMALKIMTAEGRDEEFKSLRYIATRAKCSFELAESFKELIKELVLNPGDDFID